MNWEPTLRQLEYLVAVAETGRFHLAAKRCAVSQPALSKQVREIEDGLGLQLFERLPTGTVPTSAGQALLSRARRVLTASRELLDEAKALRDPFAGTVTVGAIPTISPFLLPGLVHAVAQELPAVQLHLVEEQTEELAARLHRGELDVALVALPYPAERMAVHGLFDEPFFVVAPKGHALAGDGPVLASLVAKERLILLEQGHCLRDHAMAACHLDEDPSVLQASSLGTLLLMVQQGLGATLLPAMALPEPLPEGLHARLIAPEASRGIALWWRPSSPRAALFERLGQLVREAWRT